MTLSEKNKKARWEAEKKIQDAYEAGLLDDLSASLQEQELPGTKVCEDTANERVPWKTFFTRHVDERYSISRRTFLSAIQRGGYEITYSSPQHLVLDIDQLERRFTDEQSGPRTKAAAFQQLRQRMTVLQNSGLPIVRAVARPSWRKGCWHVVVHVQGATGVVGDLSQRMEDPWARCALQMFLGSDPIKEAISWRRIDEGDLHPSLVIDDAYGLANSVSVLPPEVSFKPDPGKADPSIVRIENAI